MYSRLGRRLFAARRAYLNSIKLTYFFDFLIPLFSYSMLNAYKCILHTSQIESFWIFFSSSSRFRPHARLLARSHVIDPHSIASITQPKVLFPINDFPKSNEFIRNIKSFYLEHFDEAKGPILHHPKSIFNYAKRNINKILVELLPPTNNFIHSIVSIDSVDSIKS